jgi:hypothetical protein
MSTKEGRIQVGVKDEWLDTKKITQPISGIEAHQEMVRVAAMPGAGNDAFGRLRVSEPTTLFDSKQIFDSQPLYWDDQETAGSGTSSTHSANRASSMLKVSLNTAGTRIRQTYQRFNYQPGKSLLVLCTAVPIYSGGGDGITVHIGPHDADNGVFYQHKDGVNYFVRRTNISGTPTLADEIAQSDWNGDKLDGTGDSGITLDETKAQILWWDFEWLGVGSVRMGFVINGEFICCHFMHHANTINSVYMSTPNLPIRYMIINDGTGAATELEHICSSVMVEGGQQALGQIHWESTEGTHIDANTADTVYAVKGMRLKSTHLGQQVDLTTVSMIATTSDDFEWILLFNPTVAGTFTFADHDGDSAVQTATGVTANTVTGGTEISGGYVKSGQATGSFFSSLENAIRLGAAIDGTRDEMVLCVRPLSVNLDIEGGLGWRELT